MTRPSARTITAPDVKTIAAIVREASAMPIRNASFASPIPIPRRVHDREDEENALRQLRRRRGERPT